jgi:hypothetical protein
MSEIIEVSIVNNEEVIDVTVYENIGAKGDTGLTGAKGDTGNTGPANTLTIPSGGVTTGAAGSSASATITGTAPNQNLTFVIPRGDTGATGIQISSTAPSATNILWADTTLSTTFTSVPSGGTTGQSLVKVSNSDYALGWSDPTIQPSQITGTAVVTGDSRLVDARTPTLHKNSHATGGSDVLIPSDIGAVSTSVLAAQMDLSPNTAETIYRRVSSVSLALTTGNVWFTNFSPLWSFSATQITCLCSVATPAAPAVQPTIVRAGIYSYNDIDGYTLLNASVNDITMLNATSYRPFTIPATSLVAGSRYAIAYLVVTANTAPQIYGRTDIAATNAGTTTAVSPMVPRLSGLLASQSDLPSSVALASITNTASSHWGRIS